MFTLKFILVDILRGCRSGFGHPSSLVNDSQETIHLEGVVQMLQFFLLFVWLTNVECLVLRQLTMLEEPWGGSGSKMEVSVCV